MNKQNPGRLTGSLSAYQVWTLAGDNEMALQYAQSAVELAPQSPVALAAVVRGNLRLNNADQARVALDQMLKLAPNNETAIITSMWFYLLTGDLEALDSLSADRPEGYIDKPGWAGTELLFERLSWAATAKLALGEAGLARELLEKGIPEPAGLDPRPAFVHTLALLVRARNLTGDTTGADTMAESAEQLVQRMRDQGWQGPQLDYTLASLAAAQGLGEQALANLRDGIEAGWDDFVMTNHDPVMADIIHLPEYLELSD